MRVPDGHLHGYIVSNKYLWRAVPVNLIERLHTYTFVQSFQYWGMLFHHVERI